MNFRNKKLVITVRTLLGLLLIFSGIGGFYAGFNNMAGVPPEQVPFTQMLWNSGLFQLIKATEILVGLMLVFGFLPWLALLPLACLSLGIVTANAMLTPEYLPIGLIVGLATAYLGYVYWHKYKQLFERSG